MGYKERGKYLDEFKIEEKIYTARRTILDTDVINFAGISGDYNPLHIDDIYSQHTIFGKRIAHGALGVSIMTGLVNQLGIFEGTTIALLEMDIKFKKPIFIGETIYTLLTPVQKIKTSDSKKGILECEVLLCNSNDEVLISSNWTLMMKSKIK